MYTYRSVTQNLNDLHFDLTRWLKYENKNVTGTFNPGHFFLLLQNKTPEN